MLKHAIVVAVSLLIGVLAAVGTFRVPEAPREPGPVVRSISVKGDLRSYECRMPAGWLLRGPSCECITVRRDGSEPLLLHVAIDCSEVPPLVEPGLWVHRPDGERLLVPLPCR
jgi:hypothetical protein